MINNLSGPVLVAAILCVLSPTAGADHRKFRYRELEACTSTSQLMQSACSAEARDDYYVAAAKCLNEKDYDEQQECRDEAREEFGENLEGCGEQFEARQNVCAAIGEDPYDPSFEAEDFETSLASLTFPNSWFPLAVGNRWIYGGDEDIEVEVLNATKLIDEITCFVVRDVVTEDGNLVEDTDDWFAISRIDGSIWYCGEESKDYEYFEGDVPSLAELVSIDGSFKVERDGDRAGIVFPGNPQVGDVFRQEFSLGNAEDVAEILSTTYSYGADAALDELVPEELADLLCNNDCVVAAEFTPLEPGGFERKYYARGIGFFLGTNPEDGESVQLIDCSFNATCSSLPDPD